MRRERRGEERRGERGGSGVGVEWR